MMTGKHRIQLNKERAVVVGAGKVARRKRPQFDMKTLQAVPMLSICYLNISL